MTVPATSVLFAQQPTPAPAITPTTPVPPPMPVRPSEELPNLAASVPDVAAEPEPRFFTPAQFAALRKVSDILMPAMNGAAGALDAKAPEFLDFLIGDSPTDRQRVYKAGLDALNEQAMKRFKQAFAGLDASQADTLMAPLRQTWTFDEPSDPVAAFLRVAKQDVRTATVNSREYSAASTGVARRFGGGGQYWYPLD